MRRKTLIKVLVSSALTLGFCLAAGLAVVSCQKQSLDDEPLPSAQRSANPGSWKYLEFTDGFTRIDNISDDDMSVILTAAARSEISQKEGRWQTSLSSAIEGNMSSEGFEYIRQVVERKNAETLSELENVQLTPRTRMVGEPIDEELLRSDCFPRSIGWIHDNYGIGYSTARAIRGYFSSAAS